MIWMKHTSSMVKSPGRKSTQNYLKAKTFHTKEWFKKKKKNRQYEEEMH